jgi:hypothetical protein
MSILVIFITGKQNGGYHRKLPASLLMLKIKSYGTFIVVNFEQVYLKSMRQILESFQSQFYISIYTFVP